MHARRRRSPARSHVVLAQRRVHGARLRRRQIRTLLPPSLYRHGDSVAHRSVRRASGQARDVVLRAVRALQARPRPALGHRERKIRRHRHRHHRRIRAQHSRHHPAPPGRHAARSRTRVRPHRRQHLPGRAFARATLLPAPGRRLGAIPHAHQEPLHVRIGHASWRRHHGRAGPPVGARDSQRRQGGCRNGRTSATSSSSVAVTTAWSPRSISPRLDSSRSFSNAARRPAAPLSPKNSIPASAAPRFRIPPDRFAPTSCATCNSSSTA